MARYRREIVIGAPHHVVHRAAHRLWLFDEDEDRRYYLALLHRFSRAFELRIAGFCLMDNHVHLIAIPMRLRALSRCIGTVHRLYSEHINHRRSTRGSNWEGRYFSTVMDPTHARNALRYIERNPVAAGLVSSAADWQWSSAACHCGHANAWPLLTADIRSELERGHVWADLLGEELSEEELQVLPWAAVAEASLTCLHGGLAAVPEERRVHPVGSR
jgi:putative transposase